MKHSYEAFKLRNDRTKKSFFSGFQNIYIKILVQRKPFYWLIASFPAQRSPLLNRILSSSNPSRAHTFTHSCGGKRRKASNLLLFPPSSTTLVNTNTKLQGIQHQATQSSPHSLDTDSDSDDASSFLKTPLLSPIPDLISVSKFQ